MPRKGPAQKRDVIPDLRYNNKMVSQFINKMMLDGKKSVSERIVYGALDVVEERTKGDPVALFKKAMDNARPALEVKSRRVGGATYQVPIEVNAKRSTTLAMRWMIAFARNRREKTMALRLAGELMDCANNTGSTIKKREDTHKMAEANKAFAHYRW